MMTSSNEQTRKIMELLREGRSDTRIAKRLGISRDEVRAVIHSVIDGARLDDPVRMAVLAEQLGIARTDDN
jgi:DNA-binding NarL/FixJ family response regulator